MHSERPKAAVSWSSGKDSAFAFWRITRGGEVDVVELLTTVTKSFGRVSIHGVREALLERQAWELGLPLRKVEIPFPCPNVVYEEAMSTAVGAMKANSVDSVIFGDLF
ncbi:MAG: ATP-binding protein, partial [Thermoplasmata archaeon]